MLISGLQNINLDAPLDEGHLENVLQDSSHYRTWEYWVHWHSLQVSGEFHQVYHAVKDIGERVQTRLRDGLAHSERLTVNTYAGPVPDHEKASQEVVLRFPGIGTEMLVSYDAPLGAIDETLLASVTRYTFNQINDLVRYSMEDFYSIRHEGISYA